LKKGAPDAVKNTRKLAAALDNCEEETDFVSKKDTSPEEPGRPAGGTGGCRIS